MNTNELRESQKESFRKVAVVLKSFQGDGLASADALRENLSSLEGVSLDPDLVPLIDNLIDGISFTIPNKCGAIKCLVWAHYKNQGLVRCMDRLLEKLRGETERKDAFHHSRYIGAILSSVAEYSDHGLDLNKELSAVLDTYFPMPHMIDFNSIVKDSRFIGYLDDFCIERVFKEINNLISKNRRSVPPQLVSFIHCSHHLNENSVRTLVSRLPESSNLLCSMFAIRQRKYLSDCAISDSMRNAFMGSVFSSENQVHLAYIYAKALHHLLLGSDENTTESFCWPAGALDVDLDLLKKHAYRVLISSTNDIADDLILSTKEIVRGNLKTFSDLLFQEGGIVALEKFVNAVYQSASTCTNNGNKEKMLKRAEDISSCMFEDRSASLAKVSDSALRDRVSKHSIISDFEI